MENPQPVCHSQRRQQHLPASSNPSNHPSAPCQTTDPSHRSPRSPSPHTARSAAAVATMVTVSALTMKGSPVPNSSTMGHPPSLSLPVRSRDLLLQWMRRSVLRQWFGLAWFRRRHWLCVLCFFNAVISYADRTNISIAILPMAQEFGWSKSTRGFLLSAFFYGYMCTQILGGYLAYRFGGKPTLAVSCVLWSLFTCLTPVVAHNLFLLTLCRILLGLSEGMGFPSIMALISAHIPDYEHARAIGFCLSGSYLGAVLANLVSAQLLDSPTLGWPSVFYIFGALGLVWLVPWLWLTVAAVNHPYASLEKTVTESLPPPVEPTVSIHASEDNVSIVQHDQFLRVLEEEVLVSPSGSRPPSSKIIPVDSALSPDNSQQETTFYFQRPVSAQPLRVLSGTSIRLVKDTALNGSSESIPLTEVPWLLMLRTPQVWAILVANFCQAWSFWLIINWLPTYYKDVFHADIKHIGFFTIVPYILQGVVGNLVGMVADSLVNRHGIPKLRVRQWMQSIGMVGMALFVLLAGQVASTITQGMILITLAMGIYTLTFAGVSVNHLDIAPTYAAPVYGLGNTAGQLPGILSVWLTGWILDQTGGDWNVVFGLSAIVSVLGAVGWCCLVGVEPVIS